MRIIYTYYISILFFLLNIVIFSSCKKTPVEPDPPPGYQSKLDVVWTRYFHSDKMGGELFLDPILWNDYVIVSSSHGSHFTKQRGIRVMHKQTGIDHPTWAHEPGGVVDYGHFMEDIHIGGENNNILFTGANQYLYAVDLNTGQRVWKLTYTPNIGIQIFSMLSNTPLVVYKPQSGGLSKDWCRIAKCDLNTGLKTDLVEDRIEDNYEFLLRPPAWAVNNAGDTLILYLNGGWNFQLGRGNMKACCYNISQKEMLWEKINFVEGGDAGFNIPLIIDNNMVVFQVLRHLHCFDITSGNIVWQYIPSPMESFSESPILYRDNRIYVRSDSGKLTCLNANNGDVIWKNTTNLVIPAPDGRMDTYDGKLYVAGWGENVEFYLYCFSAHTGEFLWKDKGPFEKICEGLIIDQNTGYLYCMNDRTIVCVNLNNTPVE